MTTNQSKIEKLISELCPNGVEFKELGELVNILDSQRRPVTREKREIGEVPYYGANGIQSYVKDYIFDGTFLLMGEDGSVINKDGSPVLNWVSGKIWVNNHAHILSEIKDKALLRYIYFSLQKTDVTKLVRGTPPKLNQQSLRSIKIPLPPLAIQEEIVNILNSFTELGAELEAELEARKKQYEHYRSKLFIADSFKNYRVTTLGEICENIASGKNKIKNTHGSYPVYGSTGIIGYSESFNYKGEVLLAARVGANAGYIYKVSGEYNVSDNTLILKPTENIDIDFLYNLLTHMNLNQYAKGGGQPLITGGMLKTIKIDLPALEEQKNISLLLNKFSLLVKDISIGLPAELSARRQQYEYYRGKLLTFNEYAK